MLANNLDLVAKVLALFKHGVILITFRGFRNQNITRRFFYYSFKEYFHLIHKKLNIVYMSFEIFKLSYKKP